MRLPADHPQRWELNDEVHARPPEALRPPLRLSYLALLSGWSEHEQERQRVGELAARFGVEPPAVGANHFSAEMGRFRLKWERHTEFARYSFFAPGLAEDVFATTALDEVPAEWIAGLPGETLVAAHVALRPPAAGSPDYEALSARYFQGHALLGATIASSLATALTDFRVQADGFSRLIIEDRGMPSRQAGRMVQRLLEIETYRMLALLGLPVARALVPSLGRSERELAHVTATLTEAGEQDEPALLQRLTRLEAEIGRGVSESQYRFSASAAYYELVQRRIVELREERIQGLQTFGEFTERRLAPAMNTCKAMAARQESLSRRASRTTQLLATRVDIAREHQSQALLESMNRRVRQQVLLQETVEGLSVVAITYYVVGLVSYLVEGLVAAGVAIDHHVAVGVSIPVVAALVFLGLRRARKLISHSVAE